MADFVAVLKKTLDGLGETTPEMRARVYDKARSTISAKLAAIVPAPSTAVAERQKRVLEDAIATVERDFAPQAKSADPLAELDDIFSSIDRNKNQPTHLRPAPTTEPDPSKASTKDETAKAKQPSKPEPAPVEEPAPIAVDDPASTSDTDAPVAAEQETVADENGEQPVEAIREPEPAQQKRGYGKLIATVIALLVFAGGGYGLWINKDAFTGAPDDGLPETVVVKPIKITPSENEAAADTQTPPPKTPATPPANGSNASTSQKFTQRLLPDGKEANPGPAGGESGIGEGTSVVALTTSPSPTAPLSSGNAQATANTEAPAPAEAEATVPVGQKAIYYEERTNVADGSAEPGTIVWSLVQESPGGNAPPEAAIRGEVTIPGKDLQLRLTIRRNADQTLPASHIIEMIFLTPDGFEGGGIDKVLRMAMKTAEQDAGSPLIGIPAKIADGYFLVALNDTKADEAANLTLLRNQEWIDVPVVYKSGRRALITMEKGVPGEKVFDEALKAWQAKSAGEE